MYHQEQFQPNHRLCPSQIRNWNLEPWSEPTTPRLGPQVHNPGPPAYSTGTMLSRFEPPALDFYAAERYMGLAQYESRARDHSSKTCEVEFPLYQSTGSFSSNTSTDGSDSTVELNDTLQAMIKTPIPSPWNHYKAADNKLYRVRYSNFPTTKFVSSNQDKLPGWSPMLIPSDYETKQPKVSYNSHSYQLGQQRLTSHQEKQRSKFPSGNSLPSSSALSNKTRIRWTQDLHEKFVQSVNQLGGAEKATPKAILKLMDSEGLTIFHIKSHLQKYRIAKYIPESAEGKSDRRGGLKEIPHIDAKSGMQIREALQLQLDVQRRLHEQLEIQRNLQLRIEEQGRQLRMMIDQQQKTKKELLNKDKANSIEDFHISAAEGSKNTNFPSKIS